MAVVRFVNAYAVVEEVHASDGLVIFQHEGLEPENALAMADALKAAGMIAYAQREIEVRRTAAMIERIVA
jgi:hypothetical protein